MDKTLLATAATPTTTNKAGGLAYNLSSKEQLAQYSATGFFGSTYYTSANEQLEEVAKLCLGVDDAFIAKCAIYARKQGRLKDMPAYLLAVLAARRSRHLATAFSQVIDNGKMLRNFVQIVRSGVTGRKSFGSRPRRLIERYLNERSPLALFRDSIGETPSLASIIRLIRPNTDSAERRALYGYLIGDAQRLCRPRKDGEIDKAMIAKIVARQQTHKLEYVLDEDDGTVLTTKYDASKLPATIKQYEKYKATREGEIPDVDFRLLDALGLDTAGWTAVARKASWLTTLKNLNTFKRHGVLDQPEMVELIADRLANGKPQCLPYQIMQAYKAVAAAIAPAWQFTGPTGEQMPSSIVTALASALEHSLENVPFLDANVAICLDVSGSMSAPITGTRKGATSKVRYVDAAALFAVAFMKRAKKSIVLPFDTRCYLAEAKKEATVLDFAMKLAALGGGGTMCELPLIELNKRNLNPDIVIFVSDNESWFGAQLGYKTQVLVEWQKLKKRSPRSKLVCIDIAAATSTQAPSAPDRLNVGGFSDTVFEVVADFISGDASNWIGRIESIAL